MTTQTITELTEHIRAVALRRSHRARQELDQMATAFEAQAAELLTALGRIALGTKTLLARDAGMELSPDQLREALAMCVSLAETAIGMEIQPKLDG